MPTRDPLQQWLQQSRKTWGLLAQAAAWVVGVLGGFLLPPPVGIAGAEDKTWLRFGQFVVAMIIGLVFFGVLKWKQKKHAKWWWLSSFLFLLLAVGAFFRYQHLREAWTGNCQGQKVVIGSAYTAQGQKYVQENPHLSVDLLLDDFIGIAEDIWTRDSIQRRRLLLAATYVSCLPLFTVAVIAVVQALQCLRSGEGKKKAAIRPVDKGTRGVRVRSSKSRTEARP